MTSQTTSSLTRKKLRISPNFNFSNTKTKTTHVLYADGLKNLTLEGLIDTGALTSAISEQELNKIKLIANVAIKDTGQLQHFQIMVANGQLEVPIGTVLLEFEVPDFM